MLKQLLLFLLASFEARRSLALENVALRHQLEVLQRNVKRSRLKPSDRVLWAVLFSVMPEWRRHLSIVKPDTVYPVAPSRLATLMAVEQQARAWQAEGVRRGPCGD